MGLIVLRYGEIGLKGQNRARFLRTLRHNLRAALRADGVTGTISQEGQRVHLETDQVPAAIEAARRVFGFVSLSPAYAVAADLSAISQQAVHVSQEVGLGPQASFRVTARRGDKSFPVLSPEIERLVGAEIVAATGARVNLSAGADVEIGIEVRRGGAHVFGNTVRGPGGLPLGSQGRVVVLLSSGIDSPVAAWLMMKRGCSVIPLHFTSGKAQTDQVEAIVDALNRYAAGWRLEPVLVSHEEVMDDLVASLRELRAERWACVFCKRAMLAKASQIADERGAAALVTGDSLGQVASQTLRNLEAISYGTPKPILRPLIGLDKTEIMAIARAIGTFEPSTRTSHTCPYVPARPLTRASMGTLLDLLGRMEAVQPGLGPGGPRTEAEVP